MEYWDRIVVPKRRCESNLRCVTSQKKKDRIHVKNFSLSCGWLSVLGIWLFEGACCRHLQGRSLNPWRRRQYIPLNSESETVIHQGGGILRCVVSDTFENRSFVNTCAENNFSSLTNEIKRNIFNIMILSATLLVQHAVVLYPLKT